MKKETVRRAGDFLLGLLYPHVCPFCGKVSSKRVCGECEGKIRFIQEPRCKKCGRPLSDEAAEYCADCLHTHHEYDRGYALWLHQGLVRSSIYQFKYHNRRIYGRFYAEELARRYEKEIRKWSVRLIVPIPLSRKRRKERGYNQAEILAENLSRLLGIPMDAKSLRRVRETRAQKELSPAGRRRNIRNAFSWKGPEPINGNVLLVDDIYTTGSTIDSAAWTLKKAGAGRICFLTVSMAASK